MAYRVCQHIPAFVTACDPPGEVDVEETDIANPDKVPWMERFRREEGFVEFTTEAYHDWVLISARYDDGKSWVCSVARPF